MSSTPALITSKTETLMGILTMERLGHMSGESTTFLVLRPFADGDETAIEDIFEAYKDTMIQIEIKQFELVAPDTRGGQVFDHECMEDDNGTTE